jgi:hypothetical protein
LGNVVRTLHHAVLTTDALIIEMTDDTGEWVFVVSQDGATIEAAGINAVMAGGGDVLEKSEVRSPKSEV